MEPGSGDAGGSDDGRLIAGAAAIRIGTNGTVDLRLAAT
jgi:hypothetical protein